MNLDLREKIKAGVIGHAIGDTLGVPVEFVSRETLKYFPVTEMSGYGTHNVPTGTWSDDTSMEIALMESLTRCRSFDYADIMSNFCKWWKNNEFTATGETFDIGGTCAKAIAKYSSGKPPLECGGNQENDNGNGSLMRILPVAFVCHAYSIEEKERYELVRNVSSLTHAHEISILGCYIYINLICHLLNDDTPSVAYEKTQQDDYSMFASENIDFYQRILKENIASYNDDEIFSNGYVASSLEAVLWCFLNTKSYQDAVLKAVNLGGDTDTIGAITGSMAGIHYGYDSIPKLWLEKLQRLDYLLEICDNFALAEIKI